ncbi:MAG TPA: hypothetical protein V6D48_05800 [Oculatellaceae cyanobacterium]
MTELSDWADQYRGDLEKQSSSRAAQIEALLMSADYEAIAEWLQQWQAEDNTRNSLYQRYRKARSELREERYRQRQQRLYGSVIDRITGKVSADELQTRSADPLPATDKTID